MQKMFADQKPYFFTYHVFTFWVTITYPKTIPIKVRKNAADGRSKPKYFPSGNTVIEIPTVIIKRDINTRNLLGRLSIKGIFPVRMMWITIV